ncbi:cob(II)yrinic acid a,c-diamide reductase [Rhizobium halophytocola]|uniref:Cob(II)yrinic acid a,c-diamide reductase n=1 Tax=Rhizobium halophytocola TaxID=735519 RepID=A0ABS4DZC9_9HYPH|nr:flavin reductase [Rhizobium halophytocola]MBP1851049.1 cob(II)yrinic acid a,c-diamide reductase [Rhizobium halophytocola]
MGRQAIESALYRDAMAHYAGHVQLITGEHEGVRRGVTITAACSVSDSPPMVLACLNNTNAKNAVFFDSGRFVLNTLGIRHEALAAAFAGFGGLASEDRFALGDWTTLITGAPVLSDAIASFDCRVVDTKVTATHTVLFGEVVALNFGPADQSLVYLDRAFRSL